MKTINSSLLLLLLTILFSLALSGCYTQLVYVDDAQYSSIEPPVIIIIDHPYPYPYPPPGPGPRPRPDPVPLPPSQHSPTGNEQQSPPIIRESGSRRSGESNDRQSTVTISETRPSGPTRGGR